MGSGLPSPRRAVSGIISGYVLRLVRESTGRTQIGFAEEVAVDLATVQGWESGRRPLANMKAGSLLDLRRRLPLLGADPALMQLLDPALDADRIITATLEPPPQAERHPLAGWVHTRTTAHMIAWAVNGTPPPLIAARPQPVRRGAVPTAPLLPAQQKADLFGRLRDAADSAHLAGQAAPLLRRQALYLTSYDRSPGASSWTALALHQRRGVLSVRGWSPAWAEARSVATALARQGDHQPLSDFITRALVDDDRSEAANLNYWAYWLGAAQQPQASDGFMADTDMPGWDPVTLLRLLAQGLIEAPTYAELYAHTLWALLAAHPWLPLAAPVLAGELADETARILDTEPISARARREFADVNYRLSNRTT
ncbi:helix-turn-helix domain-containing protein [Streptacidiphilus melanogenes]|uniref:helix-turn-helix domain-containing protein n=1 Tax=Streptacidiphilus melanogenes TaxID=411235 RepID=UPI001F19A7E7|nr:XRE family transcriptional regulator [Streptacidiphilus melanogenes]